MTDRGRPTNAELNLLDVLWTSAPLTVRQVAEAVYGSPSPVQYRTVQVQLDRLEKKELVARDRSSSPQCFRATVDRGRVLGDELQEMADRVCEGSLAPLLLNLAGRTKLNETEKDELRRLLEGD